MKRFLFDFNGASLLTPFNIPLSVFRDKFLLSFSCFPVRRWCSNCWRLNICSNFKFRVHLSAAQVIVGVERLDGMSRSLNLIALLFENVMPIESRTCSGQIRLLSKSSSFDVQTHLRIVSVLTLHGLVEFIENDFEKDGSKGRF